jgi:Tfp pilus assembly protein PilO
MSNEWRKEYHNYRRYFTNLGKITSGPRVKSFAWLSLTFFTICFFGVVAIRPTLVTIAKLTREIKDQREASQKLQVKINSLVAAQSEYAKVVNLLPLLEEALPENNDFPRLAFFLEETATAAAVEIRSLNFEKIALKGETKKNKDKKPYNEIIFSVGVAGNYNNLKQFLSDLEASRRIIKVQSFSIGEARRREFIELVLQVTGIATYALSGN